MRKQNRNHFCKPYPYFRIPFLVLCFLFSSCEKNDLQTGIITDPVKGRVLSTDTLRSGSFLGMQIGETPEVIYEAIKKIGPEKNIDILWITSPSFSDLEKLKGKLDYYSDLRLNNKWNTSEYVLFQIENARIRAIYSPDGRQLLQWPASRQYRYTINAGDPTDAVYGKLLQLQAIKKYRGYFSAITAFAKFISKPYDSRMAASAEWYLNYRQPDKKRITRNTLLFKDGILREIRTLAQAMP